MANEGIEIDVYRYSAPSVYVTTLHTRREPQFLRELGASGGGSLKIAVKDPQITKDPTLLDYRNILKFKVNGLIIGAMLIETKISTTIGAGEKAEEVYTVTGVSLKSWFDDAVVMPYGGLTPKSGDTRYFNFATVERGTWYDTLAWKNPNIISPVGATTKGYWDSKVPEKWPAKSFASWVWGTAYVPPASAAPNSVTLFRWESAPVTDTDIVVYVAADDYLDLWIDGEQVVKTDLKSSALKNATRIEKSWVAGNHVIAARVQNGPATGAQGNLAGLLVTVCRMIGGKEVPWFSSGGSGWKAVYNPANIPGYSIGEMISKLLVEANSRGVQFAGFMTPNFSAVYDSAGETWDPSLSWSFDIGESMASVISKIEDLGYYVSIDPVTYALSIYQEIGNKRDILIPPVGATPAKVPVIFAKGKNLLKAETEGKGKVKNSLAVKTDSGWMIGQKVQSSIDKYGVIESLFDTGAAPDITASLIPIYFSQKATPEEGATYEFVPTPGCVPFIDFQEGDWVLAPNDRDILVSRRVMSITTEELPTTGALKYTIEFDTVFKSQETILNQFVQKASGGSGGASNSNVTATKTEISPPIVIVGSTPSAPIPLPPLSLAASSVGSWSPDGVYPQAIATLTWAPVVFNTDGTDTVPDSYELWGTPSGDDGWALYATVPDNSAVVGPVPAGGNWQFKVRAINGTDGYSDFSTTINHTMATPSTPLDKPTLPTLASTMGVLQVTWDGKLNGLIDPPPQFRYVFAEVSPHSTDLWTRMGPVLQRGGGTISISGLVVGATYDVRLRAVDGVGIVSAPTVLSMKMRINLVQDPNTTLVTRWSWPVAATAAAIVGGKLRLTATGTGTPYAYPTVTSYVNPVASRYPITGGTKYTIRADVTNPNAFTIWAVLGAAFYVASGSGSTAGSQLSARTPITAGQTITMEYTNTAASGFSTTGLLPLLYMYGSVAGANPAANTLMDSTSWQLEIDNGVPAISPFPFWSGASTDTADAHYAWLGPANASPSTMTPLGNSVQIVGVDLGDLDEQVNDAIDAAQAAAIAAASTSNQVLDPGFEDSPLVYWGNLHSGVTQDTTTPRTGTKVMKIVTQGGSYNAFQYLKPMPVDIGEQYLIRAWGRAAVAGTTNTSDIVLGVLYGSDPAVLTTYASVAPIPDGVGTTWTKWSGVWVVPVGAKWMVPVVVSNAAAAETYWIDDFSVLKQIGNGLIVDGAITAEKVAAGAIVAGAIAAGAIAAENIQAEAITAEKLAADSVTANAIAAGTITGDNIAAGTITAINLDAGVGGQLDISANDTVTIIAGQVSDVQAGVDGANDTIETMQTYYSFGPAGAVISTPDSPFTLALRSDRIEMLQNGNVVSYWDSGQMHVADFVGERVLLGNHQIEKYGTGTVVRAV